MTHARGPTISRRLIEAPEKFSEKLSKITISLVTRVSYWSKIFVIFKRNEIKKYFNDFHDVADRLSAVREIRRFFIKKLFTIYLLFPNFTVDLNL